MMGEGVEQRLLAVAAFGGGRVNQGGDNVPFGVKNLQLLGTGKVASQQPLTQHQGAVAEGGGHGCDSIHVGSSPLVGWSGSAGCIINALPRLRHSTTL